MTPLELAVVVGLPTAIAVPHLLPLERVTPLWAAALWTAALALRALAAIGLAVFVLVYLPMTNLFRVVAAWCLHDALPVLAVHLGLSGHSLAHAASILPGLALAASVLWVGFGLTRGWLALRRRLASAIGDGPRGSTVVGGTQILVGATRIGRGRIVVSAAALQRMDRDELAASLAHEEGHICRRHRPLLLIAAVLAALGRVLPGTRAAERELAFHLERDADEYAVQHTADPLALASAICKAATDAVNPVLVALGGHGRLSRRLGYLVDGAPSRSGVLLEGSVRVLAATLAVAALLLALSVPAWAINVPAYDPGPAAVCAK